ncbi:hypothetical protein AURDEDRAFT_184075 [Auricularia subglabra TFB-10046 SS5]|nr:hypothetical protein AURDEDRAFT_184075 [Auricularia subglabra TFB-10046 SS5]
MARVHFDDNLEAAMAMLSLGDKPSPPSPPAPISPVSSASASMSDQGSESDHEPEPGSASPSFLNLIQQRLSKTFQETGLPAPRAAALTGAALLALEQTAQICNEVQLEDVLFQGAPISPAAFRETLRAGLMSAFCALGRVDPEKAALARAVVLAALTTPVLGDDRKPDVPAKPADDPIVGAYILCRVAEAERGRAATGEGVSDDESD